MSLASGLRRHRLLALLGRHDLRLLLASGLVSQTGDWMLATGIGFEIYALTGSTVATAIALLVTQAPQVVCGSVAGVLVDRWDRRRVMVAVNLLLAVVLLPLFAVHDASRVWVIFVVVGVSSCLTPFFVAAEMSLLPTLVTAEDRVTANAANAQVRNVARLVGAGLGGAVIATGGLTWLAVGDLVTFGVSALLIARIAHRSERGVPAPLRLWTDWVDGLRAVRRSRTLVVIAIFFAVSGVGEAVMGTLFAPFVSDVLGGSGRAFGTIMSAQAVGGIGGGLLVTALGHRFAPRTLFAWGAVAFGIGDLALFLSPLVHAAVWPGVVIIALVGLPGAALFAGMLTLFQTATGEANRGRAYGALITVQNLAMLASTYAAGRLAALLGILPVITVQGALYLIAGVFVLVALRRGPASGPSPVPAAPAEPLVGDVLDNPAISTRLPTMSSASNVRTQTVTDPLALRALAHPVRRELYGLVAREGSLTAADAARQLEISHALASHHLRQLAKYGFVEPAETPDHRAHPWRVTSTSLQIEPTEPEARAAADVLDRYVVEQAARHLADWQVRRGEHDPAWADAAHVSTSTLYLTPQELATALDAWREIVTPLAQARPIGHPDARPADAKPVDLVLAAVPLTPTEHGG